MTKSRYISAETPIVRPVGTASADQRRVGQSPGDMRQRRRTAKLRKERAAASPQTTTKTIPKKRKKSSFLRSLGIGS